MDKTVSAKWTKRLSHFSSAPVELRAYCIFATLTTILSFLILLDYNLNAAVVPLTGWSPALGYMPGLYFIYALIFSPKSVSQNVRFRFAIILLLAIHVFFGLTKYFTYENENFGNPYLTVSKWQPIWTTLIPVVWMIVLMSKRVTSFCRETTSKL